MFGTNEQYKLNRLPFSTEGAFLSVYQDVDDQNLYLTICRSPGVILERPRLLRIVPVLNGNELSFTYHCDEAKLTIETEHGAVEITYEEPEIMRVRVCGIALRVYCEPVMHEGAFERAEGEVEMAFSFLGKLLFKQISGKLTNTTAWNFRQVSPYPFIIDIAPDQHHHIGEAAIYEYYSNIIPRNTHKPFDQVYKELKAKFAVFYANYPPVPPEYKDMSKKAAWLVWSTKLGPRGSLTSSVIYMHKLFFCRAFGWHHCFHAMAMENNAREACKMLLTMFDYQNVYGGIPDNISDMNQFTWISTKPPLFGYAVCYLLDHFDTSTLRQDDYGLLYLKLSRYADWWFIHHDHAKTGYPSYYHPDESGYDEATLFNKGLPIQAPDLQAYMVVLCEALSRLAALLGKDDEAAYWLFESKRVLNFLVNELWDGEQFLAKLTATGELYKCGSVAQLQPIMLGSRLPAGIVQKIKARLTDPVQYLTDYGIASEHLQSDHLVMRAFTRGAVVAPIQFLIIMGLFEAGEKETAQMLAERYLRALLQKGLALGIHPYQREPLTNEEIPENNTPLAVGFPFSPWVASIFLSLAGKVVK